MRLDEYDYSQEGVYFVTICVESGRKLLGEVVGASVLARPKVHLSNVGGVVEKALIYYNENHPDIRIKNYVIMPNHIHVIIAIVPEAGERGRSPLQYIIRNLKSFITKSIGYSIWQKSFHDHVIRNASSYQRICQYIDQNLAKWQEDRYYTD